MNHYNRQIIFWVACVFLVGIVPISGWFVYSRDDAEYKSFEATAFVETQNAPTLPPTLTSEPTITLTPTPTVSPTTTITPVPCIVTFPSDVTLFVLPGFVNFPKNQILKRDSNINVFFRLEDEPWWYVNSGKQTGWIFTQGELGNECSSQLSANGLAYIRQDTPAILPVFEDTFEIQSSKWQHLSGEQIPVKESLFNQESRINLNENAHGTWWKLPSQEKNAAPQVSLDVTIEKTEWSLLTLFQYSLITDAAYAYIGVRIFPEVHQDESLDVRFYPHLCRYEIYSVANDVLKLERQGTLVAEACKQGIRFPEASSGLQIPYGFFQLDIANQKQDKSLLFTVTFNGASTKAEIADLQGKYRQVKIGLTSANMRSYLDYFLIAGK